MVYTDLPRNDFSQVFRNIHGETDVETYINDIENLYVFSSATSFHKPMFPPETLNLGFSATASHYISEKPCTIENHVHMGSYGVGVSRLVGAIIEASHDEKGIVWPEAVAPFDIGLVNVKIDDPKCSEICHEFYRRLHQTGLEVLYDDRDERTGSKLADMDLIGLPWQIIVGPRGLKSGVVELKNRKTGSSEELTIDEVMGKFIN